ncbi:MAG: thioesterase family protein [Planctomycetaceae bacterium]
MSAQFTTTRFVEFSETDMAGIVHFANFYRYMEEAEHRFFRSLGLSIMDHQPDGSIIGWPRVAASCSFEAPAFYEDEIEIRLNVVNMGRRSLTIEAEFWRGETRLAHGEMKTVCCLIRHGEKISSMDIPNHYREKLSGNSE